MVSKGFGDGIRGDDFNCGRVPRVFIEAEKQTNSGLEEEKCREISSYKYIVEHYMAFVVDGDVVRELAIEDGWL